ncbi:MAG: CPBP family intramembrane glutamic endopeptidase [Candidatus Sigynarchaeum springense]
MAGTVLFSSQAAPEDLALARKVFLLSLLLTCIYLLVGFKWFFIACFGATLDAWQIALAWPVYRYCLVFCLLFLVPWYLSTRRWGLKVSELGWRWGNVKLGIILLVIGLGVAIASGFVAAGDPTMVAFYPMERVFVDPNAPGYAGFNIGGVIVIEAMYVVLYYIPYELFFRGISMIPLVEKGKVRTSWAVLYTTAITTAVHWDVPTTELVSALVVGIIFGIVVLKTSSIRYVLIAHVATGIMTNIMCMLVLQGFY